MSNMFPRLTFLCSLCFVASLLFDEVVAASKVKSDSLEGNDISSGTISHYVSPHLQEERVEVLAQTVVIDISNDTDTDNLPNNQTNSSSSSLIHGFLESFPLIFVSELGDKTFFLAAILAMAHNRGLVYASVMTCVLVMTTAECALGTLITAFIPEFYIQVAFTASMFLFGLKLLWDVFRYTDADTDDLVMELEQELAKKGHFDKWLITSEEEAAKAETLLILTKGGFVQDQQPRSTSLDYPDTISSSSSSTSSKDKLSTSLTARLAVFLNCFMVIFLAEWGDKSQLTTIVLASRNDPVGVCAGAVLGDALSIGLAVLAGDCLGRTVGPRWLMLAGAVLFLGFGVASLLAYF